MSQFIITLPELAVIPAFLDSLAESDEYSEFIDNHRGVLIGFLDQVFDQLAFSGQEICPSEESLQCPDPDQMIEDHKASLENTTVTELAVMQDNRIRWYRVNYGNTVADAYDTERALERIQS